MGEPCEHFSERADFCGEGSALPDWHYPPHMNWGYKCPRTLHRLAMIEV